jgi:hypothetical protein
LSSFPPASRLQRGSDPETFLTPREAREFAAWLETHPEAKASSLKRPKNRAANSFPIVYPEPMQTVKEQVLHALHRLPDDADFRDVNEEIALLAAVAEAEDDIRGGRLIGNHEMKARLDEWLDA